MSEENDLVFQVVIVDCSLENYDDEEEDELEVKRFNIYEMNQGEVEDSNEIQFIDDVQADDPDGNYEEYGTNEHKLKIFKTYDEADSYRQKLICSYEASENKYEWIPEDVKL
jgi:hypothetical protein